MQIHPFQAIVPELDLISSPDAFFKTVKLHYNEYSESGFFKELPGESFFIYRIDAGTTKHHGIVACIDIKEFINGNVLKHEHILPPKAQVTTELILQRRAMIKPILLTHPTVPELKTLISVAIEGQQPTYAVRFKDNGQVHEFWSLNADQSAELSSIFRNQIPQLYIADGHHRSAVIAKLANANKAKKQTLTFKKLLATVYSFDELVIHDYNRVVEITRQVSPVHLMAKLSKIMHIEVLDKPQKPERSGEITMCLNREWFLLKWRSRVLKEYKEEPAVLDVRLLNEKILEEICGIEDLTDDSRIKYVDGVVGIEGLLEKVYKNQYRVAFCLYPVDILTFQHIADAGEVLPPKSTWFEPRIINGLIAHSLETDA
jgi:uncharacterized protein (DUF1015 family)